MKMRPNNKHTLTRRELIGGAAAGILLGAGGLHLFSLDAEAFVRSGSCGRNRLCKDLEGKGFDQIRYSSMGSELVVLYDMKKHGEVTLFSSEKTYTRAKGTVNDAIDFLSSHSEYRGFRIVRARKTTGWFRAETIDGMYIIEPQYVMPNENKAPYHNISEKDGKFTVYLRSGIPDRWKLSDGD